MNSPCKECIVLSMCQENCEKFDDYIVKVGDGRNSINYVTTVSKWLKKSRIDSDIQEVHILDLSDNHGEAWLSVIHLLLTLKDGDIVNKRKGTYPIDIPITKGLIFYTNSDIRYRIIVGFKPHLFNHSPPMYYNIDQIQWKLVETSI